MRTQSCFFFLPTNLFFVLRLCPPHENFQRNPPCSIMQVTFLADDASTRQLIIGSSVLRAIIPIHPYSDFPHLCSGARRCPTATDGTTQWRGDASKTLSKSKKSEGWFSLVERRSTKCDFGLQHAALPTRPMEAERPKSPTSSRPLLCIRKAILGGDPTAPRPQPARESRKNGEI